MGGMGRGFGHLGSPLGGVPGWVLRANGVPANIGLDIANGRYYGTPLAAALAITRASSKTDLLPTSAAGFAYATFGSNVLAITPTLGLLIEEARTNQLLNSAAPVTQTTASLGTGTYTLWVNGSGSALASGGSATITGAAAASNGSPNTFGVTVAGTVVVTVTGSLNAFQLEAGAFGTSLIVTAGVTATRATDSIQATGLLNTLFNGASASLIATASYNGAGGALPRIFDSNSQTALFINGGTGGPLSLNYGGAAVATTANTLSALIPGKMGASWTAGGQSVVLNGGTVATGNAAISAPTLTYLGNRAASDRPLNGYLANLFMWGGASRISDASLKALTT